MTRFLTVLLLIWLLLGVVSLAETTIARKAVIGQTRRQSGPRLPFETRAAGSG
jgi:hypothetical protein